MTDKTCNSCDFSEDTRSNEVVVCKRYPPIPYPVPTGSGVIGGNNGIGQILVYPVVKRTDWCGEWSSESKDFE